MLIAAFRPVYCPLPCSARLPWARFCLLTVSASFNRAMEARRVSTRMRNKPARLLERDADKIPLGKPTGPSPPRRIRVPDLKAADSAPDSSDLLHAGAEPAGAVREGQSAHRAAAQPRAASQAKGVHDGC